MDQQFRTLGFSEIEARTYLALAEVGKAPATLIAKRVGVPRSTAYSILSSLIARGVVAMEKDAEPVQYLPLPPQALGRMVTIEREAAEKDYASKSAAAQELKQLIAPLFRNQHYSVPRIQFFEGSRNVEAMLYANEDAWQESISHFDSTWWGYQDTQFVEVYRSWLDHYWSKLRPAEKIWLLSNRADVERKLRGKVARREIKPLPKGVEFSSTIWVLGEYVILIMTRQQPHYAFQLKDAVFASNQRMIFELLWKLIK